MDREESRAERAPLAGKGDIVDRATGLLVNKEVVIWRRIFFGVNVISK